MHLFESYPKTDKIHKSPRRDTQIAISTTDSYAVHHT